MINPEEIKNWKKRFAPAHGLKELLTEYILLNPTLTKKQDIEFLKKNDLKNKNYLTEYSFTALNEYSRRRAHDPGAPKFHYTTPQQKSQ